MVSCEGSVRENTLSPEEEGWLSIPGSPLFSAGGDSVPSSMISAAAGKAAGVKSIAAARIPAAACIFLFFISRFPFLFPPAFSALANQADLGL